MENKADRIKNQTHLTPEKKNILFFDAVCKMCDRFVQFVFARDHKRHFLYAPLQGETAKKLLTASDIEGLKSIIVYQQGLILRESQAVKAILQKLYPRWAFILWALPNFLANGLYRQMAKKRYQWFGKKSTAYQASPQQSPYFLP